MYSNAPPAYPTTYGYDQAAGYGPATGFPAGEGDDSLSLHLRESLLISASTLQLTGKVLAPWGLDHQFRKEKKHKVLPE